VRPQLRLHFEGGHLLAELRGNRGLTWSAGCAVADAGDLEAAIIEMGQVPAVHEAKAEIRIAIGEPVLQSRSLHDMPHLSATDLRLLVGRHSDRYFRKNGVPLVTSARWEQRARRLRSWRARAVATEEPWVSAVERGAERAGLGLRAIQAAGQPRLILQSAQSAAIRRARHRRELRRLVLAVVLAWLATFTVLMLRQQSDLAWLRDEETRLAEPARAVSDVQRRMHEASAAIAAVRQSALRRESALLVLGSVLAALPDSAYLTAFHWEESGAGAMTGAAPDAASMLATMEGNIVLKEPRLDGAAMRDSVDGAVHQRFVIKFGSARP
jgi:hypothetical protein